MAVTVAGDRCSASFWLFMPDGKKKASCVGLVNRVFKLYVLIGIPSSPVRLHHLDSGIEGRSPQKEGPGLKFISEHESFSLIGPDESVIRVWVFTELY